MQERPWQSLCAAERIDWRSMPQLFTTALLLMGVVEAAIPFVACVQFCAVGVAQH